MGSEVRRRTEQVKIRLNQEELDFINETARSLQMTTPQYIRQMGLNYRPESKIDPRVVEELGIKHKELVDMGSQLKLGLTTDDPEVSKEIDIESLVRDLGTHMQSIQEVLTKLRSTRELVAQS